MTPGNGQPLAGGSGQALPPSARPQWQEVPGCWQRVTFPGCVPALLEAGERGSDKGDSGRGATELVAPSGAPTPSGGAVQPRALGQAEQMIPPSQEGVPKPLRTLHCGEDSQARLIVGLLECRNIRVVGLRCPCVTPGSERVSVTSRGRGRGQQCPGGGSRDPAAACPQRHPHRCAGGTRRDSRVLRGRGVGGAGRVTGSRNPHRALTAVLKLARSCQCGDIPGMQPPPSFRFLSPGY